MIEAEGTSLNLVQLEYFAQVAEQKSFTRAAEKLFVSQPALSKSIQTLEKELNTRLLERTSQGLKVTPDGELVLRYARELVDHYNRRTAEMCSLLNPQRNVLRFGLPPSAGTVYFSKIIYQYARQFPQVDLQITEVMSKEIHEMVRNDQLDLGVVIFPFSDPDMEVKRVYASEAMLVVNRDHPLARRREVCFSELKDEPFLTVSKNYMYYDQVLSRCQEAGFTPHIVFQTSQWDILLEMAAEGNGVTILEKSLVTRMSRDRLRCVHLTQPEFPWSLGLIHRRDKPMSPDAKAFWTLCAPV